MLLTPPHITNFNSPTAHSITLPQEQQNPFNGADLRNSYAALANSYPVHQSIRQNIRDDIRTFSNLEDGWIGPRSHKIPQETTNKVMHVADLLERIKGLPDPEVTPTQNGTISLEWESEKGDVYIEFGKTLISGFLRLHGHPTEYFDHVISLEPSFYSKVEELLFPSIQTYSITAIQTVFDDNFSA